MDSFKRDEKIARYIMYFSLDGEECVITPEIVEFITDMIIDGYDLSYDERKLLALFKFNKPALYETLCLTVDILETNTDYLTQH